MKWLKERTGGKKLETAGIDHSSKDFCCRAKQRLEADLDLGQSCRERVMFLSWATLQCVCLLIEIIKEEEEEKREGRKEGKQIEEDGENKVSKRGWEGLRREGRGCRGEGGVKINSTLRKKKSMYPKSEMEMGTLLLVIINKSDHYPLL